MEATLADMDLAGLVETARRHGACAPSLRMLERYADMSDLLANAPKPMQASWVSWYSTNVLKARWPEAESVILEDGYTAACYAVYAVDGRWPEAESLIATDPVGACVYARYVLGARWPEAEEVMFSNPTVKRVYMRAFGLK